MTTEKQRKCQLNSATKSLHFHGMVKEGAFDYWEIQNENSVRYTLMLSCVFNFQAGLPDYCICGAKLLTILFVLFCICLLFSLFS